MADTIRSRFVPRSYLSASLGIYAKAYIDFCNRDNVAALHLGELDKLQKENSYSHKAPITTTMNMPAPPLVSPSLYSGPPPPYSYPSSTASSVVGVPNGLVSPPSTRRTSDEDKELPAPARQALPSIHEALGQEQKITVSSMLSNTTAPPSLSHMLTSTSPVVPNSRYPDHTPTKPLPPLSQSQSAPSYYQSIQDQPRHYSPRLPVDLGLSRPPPIITQPQPRPISSPTTASRLNGPYTSHPSPPYERLQSAHSQTMYSPSQPNMQYTSQPPITTYPIPSMPYPAWRNPPDVDRAQVAMQTAPKASPTGAAYGATVKRQLDIFDLELSLNEVCKLVFLVTLTFERVDVLVSADLDRMIGTVKCVRFVRAIDPFRPVVSVRTIILANRSLMPQFNFAM